MNQKSRQKTASSVERDFFQLLNNSNFRIHCRYNTDNCILEPIYNNFTEISRIKKFTTIFSDETFRTFFSAALLREEISQTFQSKIFALDKDEATYTARKKCCKNQMSEELDAVDSFEKNKKAKKKEIPRYR